MIKTKYILKNATVRAINYTRYVALPKQWLENKGLDEGDSITLYLNENGNIEIAPAVESAKTTPAGTVTPA